MTINGILNVNKPEGKTSFSIISWLKRLSGEKHIGHAGTLDPIATGVLPVCFGQATRVVEYIIDSTKIYVGRIELGVTTDTFDREGKVTGKVDPGNVTRSDVERALLKFRGDIEQMPLMSDQFDVVLSNCVLNLVPDKSKAFHEIFRVLHKGGHFCISDVVIRGNLPENIRKSAEMYAGCVSGAIQLDAYLALIEKAGFKDVVINKQKEIPIPDYVLANYLTAEELRDYKARGVGVYSVTVSAFKNW